jgi:hypothetical protein
MLRHLFAVMTGFIIWSVLWISYHLLLKKAALLPADVTQPLQNSAPLLFLLIGSVVISCVSGYVSALVSREVSYTPIIVLGVLLLAVGIFFQTQYWHLMPLWYHLSFLALLAPICLLGAWLRSIHAN